MEIKDESYPEKWYKCLAAISEQSTEFTDEKWEEIDGHDTTSFHLVLADGFLSSIEEKENDERDLGLPCKTIWDQITP